MWSTTSQRFPFNVVVSSSKKAPSISFRQYLKSVYEYMTTDPGEVDVDETSQLYEQQQQDVVLFQSPFLWNEEEEEHHDDGEHHSNIALIILNSPIQQPPSPLFRHLWSKASIRICADGGANRLFYATVQQQQQQQGEKRTEDINATTPSPFSASIPTSTLEETTTINANENVDVVVNDDYIPDLIRGDLDSLLPSVAEYYQSRGTRIERDADQDCNDLDKALQAVLSWSSTTTTTTYHTTKVYVYGAFGGRFDQEMASIHVLYKWRERFHNQIYLYDDHTCAFLLVPGGQENHIQCRYYGEEGEQQHQQDDNNNNNVVVEPNTKLGSKGDKIPLLLLGEGPTCGLIPISGRCEFVTTTGFKWNLQGHSLEFGGLVSTSNRAMAPTLTVRTSHPLIFTAEVWPGK